MKYETMTFTPDNIDSVIFTDYRRKIRDYAVEKMSGYLDRDKSFKNPIHLNKIDGKYRIIDGNHRMESIRRFIERWTSGDATKFKRQSVTTPVVIHENLSIAEERELFDTLAQTTAQTVADLIKIHSDEIKIIQMIENKFPFRVSIYSNQTTLSFSNLFTIWESRENTECRGLKRSQIIDYAKTLDHKDHAEMRSFFEKYVDLFGQPGSSSPYFKMYVIWIIMSIYYRNRGVVSEEKMWEHIKDKLFNNIVLLECAKINQRGYSIDARRIVLEKLNQSWRGNKFV